MRCSICLSTISILYFAGCARTRIVSVQQTPLPANIAAVLELTRGYWAGDEPLIVSVNERDPMQQIYGQSLISVQLANGGLLPVSTLVGETESPYLYQYIDGTLVQRFPDWGGFALFIRLAISINSLHDADRCLRDFYALKKQSREWELGQNTFYNLPPMEASMTDSERYDLSGVSKWLASRFSHKFKILAMRVSFVESTFDSSDEMYLIALVVFLKGCANNKAAQDVPSTVATIVRTTDWANSRAWTETIRDVDPSIWNQAMTYIYILRNEQRVHIRQPIFVWVNAGYSPHIQLDKYIYLFKLEDGSYRYILHEYLAVNDPANLDVALVEFHLAKSNNQHWTANRMQLPRYGYKQQEIAKTKSESEIQALILKHNNAKNVIALRVICARDAPGGAIQITKEFEYYLHAS